ncbi:MAG TPA: YdcF family protein [Terriglobia bacterium]|nr:YdcF family protein [Terriglobia bacterium]
MTHTRKPPDKPRSPVRRLLCWLFSLFLAGAALVAVLFRWGGAFLVASEPLPAHAEAAVILQGSIAGELARLAGAVKLLQQNVVPLAALSVPAESYWDTPVPEEARGYIEKHYGPDIASRFVFCETGPEVNSTRQEAQALVPCIQAHGWHSIVVVTSNYHSRRAAFLWRQVLGGVQPPIQISVDGVPDPEFSPRGWWRKRLYAKTWEAEFTKLVWERIFE